MRENRQSGSEGGETFGLPYPYLGNPSPALRFRKRNGPGEVPRPAGPQFDSRSPRTEVLDGRRSVNGKTGQLVHD